VGEGHATPVRGDVPGTVMTTASRSGPARWPSRCATAPGVLTAIMSNRDGQDAGHDDAPTAEAASAVAGALS
jgi:hypothetical protein